MYAVERRMCRRRYFRCESLPFARQNFKHRDSRRIARFFSPTEMNDGVSKSANSKDRWKWKVSSGRVGLDGIAAGRKRQTHGADTGVCVSATHGISFSLSRPANTKASFPMISSGSFFCQKLWCSARMYALHSEITTPSMIINARARIMRCCCIFY